MHEPPAPSPQWALFLDFDGTLVELCSDPSEVVVPDRVRAALERLVDTFDGATAVISGRSAADLQARLAPLRLPVAGVHGLERCSADGTYLDQIDGGEKLDPVREAVVSFVHDDPRLFHEDKGGAIALHFRRAPERAREVEAFMRAQRERLGADARLQRGKAVVELMVAAGGKGHAVEAFMQEAPFRGRIPVYAGDDTTDEHALERVNELGGVSIHVGDNADTCARHRLPSVPAVVDWLERMPEELARDSV